MLVDIVSDLHVEFDPTKYKQILGDSTSAKIIMAGDIGPIYLPEVQQALTWLCNKYEEVIYVEGNHDAYGGSIGIAKQIFDGLEDRLPNLTILRPGRMTVIGDTKVVGATLWVPYLPSLRVHLINDPFQIPGLYEELGWMNTEASKFFEEVVDEDTIVVTHHLPHPKCIDLKYANEPTNIWFLSDESHMIETKKPKMVIYGHSHIRTDFMIGTTRMLNQAWGYPSEAKPFKRITYDI
jgi:predicted phosphodiesterase